LIREVAMSASPDQAKLARQARLQLVFALVSAGLAVLAALVPRWIEEVTGLEPDGGNGELEWLLPVVFGVVSIVFGVLTYRSRQQLKAAQSSA
jgi:hypothetical protein